MKCKYCGGETKHRDRVKRIVKKCFGQRELIFVERVKCVDCGRLMRVLPDNLEPFRHYDKEVIRACLDESTDLYEAGLEDYPCEMTVKRWRK